MQTRNVTTFPIFGGNIMARNKNRNQVFGADQALQQMKFEIAQEFGVQLGPDSTSRANGSVGGEITKRLVQMAENQLGGSQRRF
jgi:small acid-soluble spore protein B (major beta-type SASP)